MIFPQTFRRRFSLAVLLALACALTCPLSRAHAEPIHGKIGVGTWNTQAEFKDIKVVKGSETLYQSDFTTGLSGFTPSSGTWAAVGGALRQTSSATPATAYVGDPAWTDYTLTLKARKLSGSEGFLVCFGVPADNAKSWWNIGGWGNTQHALEVPGVWAPAVAGSVQTGVWYDIRVELSGGNVKCYLNGTLVHDTTPRPFMGKVGIGTWNTQAEFTDVKVVQGSTTLYQSDFSAGLSGFTTSGGAWAALNGSLRQTSAATPALALVGDAAWTDYTLTLRARKLGGAEGFLISFANPGDGTTTWWNIGGWTNTQHNLQVPGVWVPAVTGSIQTGVWYDIRIELQGNNVRCYLNNTLVHDTQRILDYGDRQRRFQELLASPGFSLLNAGEQEWLRNLSGRNVYVGNAARATFGAMPGTPSFDALTPSQQATIVRKVNRNRLTFSLGGGFGSDLTRDQNIINGMDAAVLYDNSVGPIFDKHDVINNSPGTPTADANYNGNMNFGGSYGLRVAMHEISHTLGTGTYYPAWGNLMVNGAWTGTMTNMQLSQFDGAGSVLHGDAQHYWPYGLNYDNEYSTENARRQVWIMHALRRDMGIATFDLAGATDIPNGLYRLTPRHAPNSSLDVVNANPANGAQIDIHSYTGADSQKFYLDLQSDGTYRIRTALSGNRTVELPNGVTDNGSKLRLWDATGNAAQRWYLTPVGDGWYKVSPKNNVYKGLDVNGISTADGALVQSWDYWDGFGQQWKLTRLATGFTMQDASQALSVAAGLSTAGPADVPRRNVEDPATPLIDLRDAIRLARKVDGLETNP